jgi:hypothetical protein
MLERYLSIKRWKLFSGIVLVNMLFILLSQTALINEIVFFNTYSEQLTYERSMELFSMMKSYSWTSYLLCPLVLIIKFSVVSLVIYIGVFFCDMQKDITMCKVFTVVIACEAVFVLAAATKLMWFIFFAGNYTLNDMHFFYPLSLVNLFRQSEIAPYWIYPLQAVNLFQLAYVIMLSAGLAKLSSVKRDTTDRIVFITYLPAITLWVVFIVFLTMDATV